MNFGCPCGAPDTERVKSRSGDDLYALIGAGPDMGSDDCPAWGRPDLGPIDCPTWGRPDLGPNDCPTWGRPDLGPIDCPT